MNCETNLIIKFESIRKGILQFTSNKQEEKKVKNKRNDNCYDFVKTRKFTRK